MKENHNREISEKAVSMGVGWQKLTKEEAKDKFNELVKRRGMQNCNYGTRCDDIIVIDIDVDKSRTSEENNNMKYVVLNKVLGCMPEKYEIEDLFIEETKSGGLHIIFKKKYISNNENKDWGKFNTRAIEYDYKADDEGKKIITIKGNRKEYVMNFLYCVDIFANNKGCIITQPSKYGKQTYIFKNKPENVIELTSKQFKTFVKELNKQFPNNRQQILKVKSDKTQSNLQDYKIVDEDNNEYCELIKILLENDKIEKLTRATVTVENKKYWKTNCFFHEDKTPSAIINDDNSFHCFTCDLHLKSNEVLRKLKLDKRNMVIKDTATAKVESLLMNIGIKYKEQDNEILFKCESKVHHKGDPYSARVFQNKIICSCKKYRKFQDWLVMQKGSKGIFLFSGEEFLQFKYGILYWKKIVRRDEDSGKMITEYKNTKMLSSSKINKFGIYENPVLSVYNNFGEKFYYIDFEDRYKQKIKKTDTLDKIVKVLSDNTFDTQTKKHLEQFLKHTIKEKIMFFNRVGFYLNKKDKITFSDGFNNVDMNNYEPNREVLEKVGRTFQQIIAYYPDPHKSQEIFFACFASIFGLVAKQAKTMSRLLYLYGSSQTGKTTQLHLFTLPFYKNEFTGGITNELGGDSAGTKARLFKNADRTALPTFIDETDSINVEGFSNSLKVIAGQQINGRLLAITGEDAVNNVYTTYLFTSNSNFTVKDSGVYRRVDFLEFTNDDKLGNTIKELQESEIIIEKNSNEFFKAIIKWSDNRSKEILKILRSQHTLFERGRELYKDFLEYYDIVKLTNFEIHKSKAVKKISGQISTLNDNIISDFNSKLKTVVRTGKLRVRDFEELDNELLDSVSPEWLLFRPNSVVVTEKLIDEIGYQISWGDLKKIIGEQIFKFKDYYVKEDPPKITNWETKMVTISGKSTRAITMNLGDFFNVYVFDTVISADKSNAVKMQDLKYLFNKLNLKRDSEGNIRVKKEMTEFEFKIALKYIYKKFNKNKKEK